MLNHKITRLFRPIFLLIVTHYLAGCEESSSGGGETAPTPETEEKTELNGSESEVNQVMITGQLAIGSDVTESLESTEAINLDQRDVELKDSSGSIIGKAKTGNDGSYHISVPGALVLGSEVSLAEGTGTYIEAIVSDTVDQSVIGIQSGIDASKLEKGLLRMGEQPMRKITAIRGRVLLDGARDHTGIAVYVPGTSMAARTDSSGSFLMTFIQPGTYEIRAEKDGYLPINIKDITVTEKETTNLGLSTLSLSGGTAAFKIKQLGSEGISNSREVEFFIDSGSADRMKVGIAGQVEASEYSGVIDYYKHTFEEDGVFQLKFIFADADGFESEVTRSILVDTIAPSASDVKLVDRDTLSGQFSNERILLAHHVTCADIEKVAIIPDDRKPRDADFVWDCHIDVNSSDVNFRVAPGIEAFSYKLWVRDKAGNTSETSSSWSIAIDENSNESPLLVLEDQTSGSRSGTDITTIYASVSSCQENEYILFSEHQLAPPLASEFNTKCVEESGAYTYTFANNVDEIKTVYVWGKDFAGNVSPVSSTASIKLDQVRPDAKTFVVKDPSEDSVGYSNSLQVTAELADCNDVTHVFLAEDQSAAPDENAEGWSECTAAVGRALDEGNRTFYLWTRDIGGNISLTATTATIHVDTTRPDIASLTYTITDSTSSNSSHTNHETVNVAVSPCSADVAWVLLTESSDTPDPSSVSSACSGGSLNTSFTFSNTDNETKTLYLWAKDIAGNLSTTSIDRQIVMDTVDPAVPGIFTVSDIDISSTDFSNSRDLAYTVDICESGGFFLLSSTATSEPAENDSGWSSCSLSGTYTNALADSQGLQTIYLWHKDVAGNINGSITDTITYDSVSPFQPTVDAYSAHTQSATLVLTGDVEANTSVSINGAESDYTVSADGSGNFSQSLDLTDNTIHNISIVATDAAGNASSPLNFTIERDNVAPTISNVQYVQTDTSVTITWTTSEITDTALVYGTSLAYGSSESSVATGTSHSLEITGLTENTDYYFKIIATDLAGNNASGNDYAGTFHTHIGKSADITSNETWSDTSTPYYISSSILSITSGVTLTISPGVEVRFSSGSTLRVEGKLVANGTSGNPIVITGNEPTEGFWNGISFRTGSTAISVDGSGGYLDGNILNYVTIEYGGSTNSMLETLSNADLYINNSTIQKVQSGRAAIIVGANSELWMYNSELKDFTGSSIYAYDHGSDGGAKFNLHNNIFETTSSKQIDIYKAAWNTGNIKVTGNIFRNYTQYAFYLSTTISHTTYTNDIEVSNNIFYGRAGATAFYNFSHTGVFNHNLVLNHTSNNGVYWVVRRTSDRDNFINNNVFFNNRTALYLGNYSFNQVDYTINYNQFVANSSASSYSSILRMTGASLSSTAAYVFQYNTLSNNTNPSGEGLLETITNSDHVFNFESNNWLANNADYAILNNRSSSTADISANNTYWGTTVSSEIDDLVYDLSDNSGLGRVTVATPASSPIVTAPISRPQNVTLTDNGGGSITLDWDANPETDLTGYKIYYDSDSGYPYEGSGLSVASGVDNGNSISATITGLTTGTYYFVVTAYDGSTDGTTDILDGNESWYSQEVSIVIP